MHRACFLLLAVFMPLVMPACRNTVPGVPAPPAPLPTVAKVDLARYAGTWHEVSRLPNPFQKSCLRSVAEYTLLPDGSLKVKNTCYKAKGRTDSTTGRATAVPGSKNTRLQVELRGLPSLAPAAPEGNYHILALDPQYRWAMVGTPDRKFLWMLSRQPQLPFPAYQQLKAKARELGFDVSKLLPEDAAPDELVKLRKGS